MIHNYKLNHKINFLLEADLSADTRFIQPVAFDQHQYPFVKPEDMQGPPRPNDDNDDPGVPVDWDEVERIFRENSPTPALHKRFIAWVKSLTPEDIGRFTLDMTLWQFFLYQLAHEYPNLDPFLFGKRQGNYPENFQNYPMGMPQYAPNKS
jgi:hypothetical protein